MELPPPPPSSSTPQQWAMLRRVPQPSLIDLSQEDFSLAFAAPPDLTRLSISDIITDYGEAFSPRSFPFVLAADPSGLLLITDSYGVAKDPLGADRPIYFVWDVSLAFTHRIRGHQESVNHSGNVGFIVTPSGRRDHDLTVVELLPVSAGESITILCYDSKSRIWTKKTLPFPMPCYPWSSANVFSHNNKLWWVDLRHGILSFDPLADNPQVLFVEFPDAAAEAAAVAEAKLRQAGHYTPIPTTPPATTTRLMRGDISKYRCVNLSAGSLRFVEMTGSVLAPRVAVWTLYPQAEHKLRRWKLDYDVNLKEIWVDMSYKETGLPNKRPVLAGLHPADPAVVYFLNKGKLFEVNLNIKKVDKCMAFQPRSADLTQLNIDEESSRFLLTWDLPPSLTSLSEQRHGKEPSARTNGEESPTTAALRMLRLFTSAYTSAFGKLEYDELARIAIVHLNEKIKKEENKFILSERHDLCSFDEKKDMNAPPKRYAHMNFCVNRYSKAKRLQKLVFAEFAKADVDGPWTLLSCKTLSKKNHGGMYNTAVEVGKKRKRFSCFACDSEIRHPDNGFVAGHPLAS